MPEKLVVAGFQLEDLPEIHGLAIKLKHSVGMQATKTPKIHETHVLIRREHARQFRDELDRLLAKYALPNSRT